LRGERIEAVIRHRHDKLPTFGLGATRSPAFWRSLIRQLIALGALDIDTEGHGGLFLVEDKARSILRGETKVLVQHTSITARRPDRPTHHATRTDSTAPRTLIAPFEALRSWRAAEAKAQRVPPYLIFTDQVLREIAAVQPRSLEELGQIKGVGSSKLFRYGTAVLSMLRPV
jgi:ATP-dependent DNA helicase RecQ